MSLTRSAEPAADWQRIAVHGLMQRRYRPFGGVSTECLLASELHIRFSLTPANALSDCRDPLSTGGLAHVPEALARKVRHVP